MWPIFRMVRDSLVWLGNLLGLSYNEINILVWFAFIPYSKIRSISDKVLDTAIFIVFETFQANNKKYDFCFSIDHFVLTRSFLHQASMLDRTVGGQIIQSGLASLQSLRNKVKKVSAKSNR